MAQIESLKVSAVLSVKRVAATLDLLADGVEEITGMGEHHLDGRAALGFSNILHACADDLDALILKANYDVKKLILKRSNRKG